MATARRDEPRRLGSMESAFTLSDERWPLNLVIALRLAAAPDAAALRAALDAVGERHPALRSRIERLGRRFVFHYDGVPSIPLAVSARPALGSWLGTVEGFLNTRLPVRTGPLSSCALLSGASDEESDVVVAFHHSIVDAVSVEGVLRDLLGAYGSVVSGRPLPWDAPLAVPPPADALFPDGYRGIRLQARRLAFVAGALGGEVRYRRAIRRAGPPPVRREAPTQVHTAGLGPEVTAEVGRRARRRRLTMHSVLQAAMLQAVHRDRYPAAAIPLRTVSFADLRPALVAPVSEALPACYLALTWQDVPMSSEGDLWEVAGEVQERVDGSVRGGAKLVASSMSRVFMRMTLAAQRFRMANTALTFTGPTALTGERGPLLVRDVHAFVSNLGVGPEFSMHCGIVEGRLTFDVMTLPADMGRSAMERITDDVMAILEGAALG